jgi:hypothetical protein
MRINPANVLALCLEQFPDSEEVTDAISDEERRLADHLVDIIVAKSVLSESVSPFPYIIF